MSSSFKEIEGLLRNRLNLECGVGATPAEIALAEKSLKIQINGGYRLFLEIFGWSDTVNLELYGLGRDVPIHLDLIRNTLGERTQFQPYLADGLLPFANDGAGNHFCLDTRGGTATPPVVFWDHEDELGSEQRPSKIADDFESWLIQSIDQLQS